MRSVVTTFCWSRSASLVLVLCLATGSGACSNASDQKTAPPPAPPPAPAAPPPAATPAPPANAGSPDPASNSSARPTSTSTSAQTTSQSGARAEEWLAKDADVVVRNLDSATPVVVRVGQTLGVMNPEAQANWQVDVPGESLKLLTPADKSGKPGEAGWVWRAMSAGTIEMAFTARTPCPNPPCGQNPLRLTLNVEIK